AAEYQRMRSLTHDLLLARERRSFTHHFPYSNQDSFTEFESLMLSIVRQGRLGDILLWLSGGYSIGRLSLRQLFQLILVVYAKLPSRHTSPQALAQERANFRRQLERMGDLVNAGLRSEDYFAGYFPVNPFTLSLAMLETAADILQLTIPQTLEEEEIKL